MRRLALCLALTLPLPAQAEDITVFAASSLKNALDVIAKNYETATGDNVLVSYEGSSKLARQIQEGAPADIFFSAATNWMDTLQDGGLIQPDSRHDLLGNSLVLVAHGKDAAAVEISATLDLPGLLADDKLAMAMVDSVPAGQYGKEALERLGLWSKIEGNVVQTENVRAALALVATGEAPYGIVYASDAVADDAASNLVTVVGTFPAYSHKPITYPVALTSAAKPAATGFLQALSRADSAKIFENQGFNILE